MTPPHQRPAGGRFAPDQAQLHLIGRYTQTAGRTAFAKDEWTAAEYTEWLTAELKKLQPPAPTPPP